MLTLFDILMEETPTKEQALITATQGKEEFPILYARSKNGNIRYYKIDVEVGKEKAKIICSKAAKVGAKESIDIYTYTTGVNIGKSNETTFVEQAYSEARSIYNRLLDSGFSTGIPSSEYNTDAEGFDKPMLASSNRSKIVFPCLGQPKYDGVRCLCSYKNEAVNIKSRKGKPYNIPQLQKYLEKNKHLLPLDGELYSHNFSFEDIVSAVKRNSDLTEGIEYIVYDKPIKDVSNKERWQIIDSQIEEEFSKKSKGIIVKTETVIIKNEADIDKYHKKFVSQGFEGLMLRNFDGNYSFGFRSSDLVKVKAFDDTEFIITDVLEATGRDAGTAIFELKVGENLFRARPKGSFELRSQYLKDRKKLIGKPCTVQYQGVSENGVPRFPVAITVRDYE